MSASATIPTADQLAYRFYTKLAAALNPARATLDPNPHSKLDQLVRISPHRPVAQLTIFPVKSRNEIKLTLATNLQQHSVSVSASRSPSGSIPPHASSSSTHPTAVSSSSVADRDRFVLLTCIASLGVSPRNVGVWPCAGTECPLRGRWGPADRL
jgi:hypothetical protein